MGADTDVAYRRIAGINAAADGKRRKSVITILRWKHDLNFRNWPSFHWIASLPESGGVSEAVVFLANPEDCTLRARIRDHPTSRLWFAGKTEYGSAWARFRPKPKSYVPVFVTCAGSGAPNAAAT